jgi:hypothetical protein
MAVVVADPGGASGIYLGDDVIVGGDVGVRGAFGARASSVGTVGLRDAFVGGTRMVAVAAPEGDGGVCSTIVVVRLLETCVALEMCV